MEKKFIATGKDFDSAVQAALKELGLEIEQVSVQLLERAKNGVFGFGARPCKVEVTYEMPDSAPTTALSAASRSKPLRNPSRKDQNPLHPSSPHRSLLRKSQRSPRRKRRLPALPVRNGRPGSQRQKKNRNLSLKRYLLPPPLAA